MAGRPARAHGGLESAILEALRTLDRPLTGRELTTQVGTPVPAVTTILTVLNRMESKGLVVKQPGDGAMMFSAAQSSEENAAEIMRAAFTSASDREAVLLQFAGGLDSGDVDVLRRALDAQRTR